MLRKQFVFLSLLFMTVVDVAAAQAATGQRAAVDSSQARSGTWSATGGPTVLMGTWTGLPDSTGRIVTGTWALVDAEGRTVIHGGWSASKTTTGWSGAWRGVIANREGEYSGTWTADLDAGRSFADLFESGVRSVVNGRWRSGARAGAWAIRTLAREGATPPD